MIKLHIFALLLAGIILSSCSDFLDKNSADLIIPSKVEDLQEYLMGEGYDKVTNDMWYLDILSDDASIGIFRGNDIAANYKGYYTWQREIEKVNDGSIIRDNAWAGFYKTIMASNITIAQLEKVSGKESSKNKLKAEALFLRAYSYFMLVNLYGKPFDPTTAATDPGVPINLAPYVQDQLFERASVAEVYAQVEYDLQQAVSLIGENTSKSSIFHAGIDACYFLWSRIALYKKDWDKSIEYASKVLENNSSLMDMSRIASGTASFAFYTKQNPEIIFSCGNSESSKYAFYEFSRNKRFFSASDDLKNLYGSSDKRLFLYLYRIPRTTYYAQNKMAFYKETFLQRNFRVAEMYLNRAEAYAEKGAAFKEKALDDIRFLRRHRVGTEVIDYNNVENAIELVRQERRRELCFESHRWFDLRRWDQPEITHSFPIFDESGSLISTETYILKKNDPAYTLQIPVEVREFNPSMIVNQREERIAK